MLIVYSFLGTFEFSGLVFRLLRYRAGPVRMGVDHAQSQAGMIPFITFGLVLGLSDSARAPASLAAFFSIFAKRCCLKDVSVLVVAG